MRPAEMADAILRATAHPPTVESVSFKKPHSSMTDLQRVVNEKTRARLVDLPERLFADAPADMSSTGFETLTLELVASLPFERFASRHVEAGPVKLALIEESELRLAVDLPPGVRVRAQQAASLGRRVRIVAGLSSGTTAGLARVYRLSGSKVEGLTPAEVWPALTELQVAHSEITDVHLDAWANDSVTLAGLRDGARALLQLDDFLHLQPETQLRAVEAAQRSKLVNLNKAEAGSAVALPLYIQRVGLAIEEAKTWRDLAALLDDLTPEEAG